MSRIRITLVIALSTLLLISVCTAQTTKLGGGPDTIVNCVGAKNGTIPIWTGSAPPNITLCNSGIYEAAPYGTGAIGILNPSPTAALDVIGDINSSKTYQIDESTVLSIGSAADDNLFLGVGAGEFNVAGQGVANTFSGRKAGRQNTTGINNTFSGAYAGNQNTTGSSNTFLGLLAGYSNTTGNSNTFSGNLAGYSNTTGGPNTFVGAGAGYFNTIGYGNTFVGDDVGVFNTGSINTFVGSVAGQGSSGSANTFLGVAAGVNAQGNNNIYIGNLGGNESNTIRIGGDVGLGFGPQTAAYVAGIYGTTASGGVPVYINSNGRLGPSASSLRFKEQVRDMGDSTNALMKLRPVTFLYKPEYANGERTLQYGLIAEEVAKLYPELVAYDNDGQPYSVRYQYLTTMLLNELQKEHRKVEELKAELQVQRTELKKQNEQLQQRLTRVETLLQSQVNSTLVQTASAVSLPPEGTQK